MGASVFFLCFFWPFAAMGKSETGRAKISAGAEIVFPLRSEKIPNWLILLSDFSWCGTCNKVFKYRVF